MAVARGAARLAAAAAAAALLAPIGAGAQPAPPSPSPPLSSPSPPLSSPSPPLSSPSPPLSSVDALREANAAATAGDWPRVAALVDPLLRGALPASDLAEAHRLSGMAAFYHQRRDLAEAHFLAYLKLDLDGRLDPALYPPDVVGFFDEVRTKHQAELRAHRPKARRYWLLNLIPPGGQLQNGERAKAWVFGSLLGTFAIGNVASYLVLRSWCTRVSGEGGSSVTCDDGKDRARAASTLRGINIAAGVGLIVTYAFGVYDGAVSFRRREVVQPFVAPVGGGGIVGLGGSF